MSAVANRGALRERQFRVAVRRYGPFEDAIRAQWSAFEAEQHTGLSLDLVALDLHALEEALFTTGGMAHGDWDLAFVATDWVTAMHDLGCAVDLAPLLAADPPSGWPDGWVPSLRRLQTVNGAVLGVPYHDGPECLVYRRDLFEDPAEKSRFEQRFHRELTPPSTWTEFHKIAQFFQGTRPHLSGTAFASFPDGHNTVYDFLLQLWTRGGASFSVDRVPCLETAAAEDALEFYRKILGDASAVHPECAAMDSVELGARFAAGELAMMVNWFGFAAAAHTQGSPEVRGNVDIAPIPAEAPGQSVSLNVYWLLALPAASTLRSVGWPFIRHILTPAMDLLTTRAGAIGCRRSTWADPEVNRSIPFYEKLAMLHATAREVPSRADWPAISRIIDQLMVRARTTQEPVRNLLQDAQHALRDLPAF